MYQPRRKAVFCKCTSHHHHAVVDLDVWVDPIMGMTDLECTIAIHLAPHPSFLTRVWNAIAYVFTGYNECYGEVMLSEEDAEELRDILGEYVAMSRGLR